SGFTYFETAREAGGIRLLVRKSKSGCAQGQETALLGAAFDVPRDVVGDEVREAGRFEVLERAPDRLGRAPEQVLLDRVVGEAVERRLRLPARQRRGQVVQVVDEPVERVAQPARREVVVAAEEDQRLQERPAA